MKPGRAARQRPDSKIADVLGGFLRKSTGIVRDCPGAARDYSRSQFPHSAEMPSCFSWADYLRSFDQACLQTLVTGELHTQLSTTGGSPELYQSFPSYKSIYFCEAGQLLCAIQLLGSLSNNCPGQRCPKPCQHQTACFRQQRFRLQRLSKNLMFAPSQDLKTSCS